MCQNSFKSGIKPSEFYYLQKLIILFFQFTTRACKLVIVRQCFTRSNRRKPPLWSRHFEFHQNHSRYLFLKNKPIQLSKPKVPGSFHYPTKDNEILPHFRPNGREGPLNLHYLFIYSSWKLSLWKKENRKIMIFFV